MEGRSSDGFWNFLLRFSICFILSFIVFAAEMEGNCLLFTETLWAMFPETLSRTIHKKVLIDSLGKA
jgi:hypothetical protein